MGKILYEKVLYEWIEKKKIEIRNSSFRTYMYTLEHNVLPALGKTEIENITRKQIQTFVISQSEKLKRETVIGITKVISQSFKYALEEKYISENPYYGIKVPKDRGIKEIKIFTKEEAEKILDVKGFSKLKKDIINLAYRTGMRIGEILALKWEDINFQNHFLTVRRTLSGYDNESLPEICEPKTRASRRRIDLDEVCMHMFNSIERNGEYVFHKADGTILSRQCITSSFKRMCKSANVTYRSFHCLRHTHASILLAGGVHPKIVQERLGHAKISTTMDTYSHLIPGIQKAAVDVFNKI